MSKGPFSDDTPKENPWTDDRLGYAPFASRLAEVAVGRISRSSFVSAKRGP